MFLNKILNVGGFTLDNKLQDKKEGYAIALGGHETIFEADKMTEQDVLNYMQAKQNIIEKNSNVCFGAWLDEKTDKIYLDLSEVHNDKIEAEKIAKNRKQLAIFNLDNFETIYL